MGLIIFQNVACETAHDSAEQHKNPAPGSLVQVLEDLKCIQWKAKRTGQIDRQSTRKALNRMERKSYK
jgi:hypothetical protein